MESIAVTIEAPALAETDIELWTEFLGDYISVWLRNSRQFIHDQQDKMYQMALCPFLFGVSHNLPQAWLELLRIYAVIDKDRENSTSPLTEIELETLDMAETVFMRCSQLVSNKNDLKTILNFVYDVEDRSALLGRIDITYALQEVAGLEVFASMWAPIKRFYEKRKRQAQVCIIYYFKIISYQVTQYGQNGADRLAYVESVLFDPLVSRCERLESVTLEDAQKTVAEGNYRLAVEQYSVLIEREPFNCYLYGQRGEAYLKLCDYWAALSDCRRSIAIEPRYCLHYYRAAKVCLELGQLDKAEDLNHQSLEYSENPCQRAQIEEQTEDIHARRRMTKFREPTASSGSEERDIYYLQYSKLICEGSDLYLSRLYNKAADQFKAALDVIARATSQELTVEGDDLALIWLAYGLSCVKTEHTRNVQAAIEKFKAIISQTQTFPAAFYGLALAYMHLKRYKEAGDVLTAGLATLGQCGDITVCRWPGTHTVMEETVGPTLKRLMEDLLKETMFPPKPDAVCKFHIDTDSLKKDMYFSDPDYKGHVCIKCRADCSIDFHAQCWRPSDGNSRGKHNWKELLDSPCPTPSCWGTVSEVYICRPGPDKNLKLSSQIETRPKTNKPQPKLKMKTGSPFKLERKLEMKRLRKERRQEARQVLQDQQAHEEQLQHVVSKIILPPEDDMVDIHRDRTGTVLHKDEPELLIEKKQKANKSKKKEKKQKQFLVVDLQFKGDEDKERFGINSLDHDGDVVNVPSTFGLLPTPGSEPSTVTTKSLPYQLPALEIALYEFFYKLLIAKGPLDVLGTELEEHTKHLSEEAQSYILSYGGLGRFLAAHRQFHVSQNQVVSAISASLLANPPVRPQVNPWEARQHKAADARSGPGHGLNPGAKEFVPVDAGSADGLPRDQDELANGAAAGVKWESSQELPPPADDEDDDDGDDEGFTPVVNKRRVNTQKLPSVVQPIVHKLGLLKPASSISSLDEIQLDSQLPKRSHQPSVSSLAGGEDAVDDARYTNVSRRKMDSQVVFTDDSLDTQPYVRKGAHELKTGVMSPVMNKPGPGSDVSDISGDDLLHRVSSPALSTNSGGSSGRAEGSHAGGQTSGQQTSLRPLKAPSILLPTRGKIKRPQASKMRTHQQPPSAGSIQLNDGCEEESASSTASDRDSSWGEARTASTDRLQTPLVAGTCGQDGTCVVSEPASLCTTSGPGAFTSRTQDRSVHALSPHLGLEKDALDGPEGVVTSHPGFTDGFQQWKMWPDSLAAEKLPQESSVSDLKMPVKSGNIAVERPEKNRKETFDNVLFQAPVEQTQFQMFNVHSECSETQSAVNMKSVPDVSWPSWDLSLSGSYRRPSDGSQGDVRVPASDPWQNPASFHADLYRDSPGLHPTSTHTYTSDVSHLLSNRDDNSSFGPFSREFGLFGSDKVKDADPWSSRSVDSPTSLATDITFHGHRAFVSPFPAWLNIENQSSSTEPKLQSTSATEPSVYATDSPNEPPGTITEQLSLNTDTSSEPLVHTSLSRTSQNRSIIEPASSVPSSEPILTSSLSRSSQNRSIIEPSSSAHSFVGVANSPKYPDDAPMTTIDHKIAHGWERDQLDRGSIEPTAAQWRSVDCQTSLSGAQMDEMLVSTNMVQDSRAQLASVLHDKLKLQEQLSRERSLMGQLKLDNSRLLKKIHTAEASAEKWKDDYSQLIATDQQLNDQARAQAETISQLSQQLDMYKTTCLKTQMDLLAMKKELVTNKIDVKGQEALHHFHRLSNVIAQAKTSQLPESVYQKQTEFSEYVATCDRLNKHIQVVYLRLAGDLQRGLPVDLSDLEISPPEFPKSPVEQSSDRPQAPASSLPHVDYTNRVHPSPPHSMASLHSSPPRGRSSIHTSPSHSRGSPPPRGRSSIHTSPSHSRGSPPPHGRSSIHSSPSHRGSPTPRSISSIYSSPSCSRPPSRTSPSRSIASVHSSPPPHMASIRSSPPPGRNQQKTAWSASKPEAQPREAEDEDADAYLKMIYGGYADSLPGVTSRPHTEDVRHQQTESLGWPGWNPASSRLLSSPTWLPTPVRAAPGNSTLPGHRLSTLIPDTARTAPTPNVRQQSKAHASHAGLEPSKQPVPYFQRIVQTVQDQLPGCSRSEVQKVIDTLRRDSGGTLTGWTFETLANTILDMILDLQQEQKLATFADGSVADEHLSNKVWKYRTLDPTCSICQCHVEPMEALTLSCGHRFHEACAHQWLSSDRSCPNCRSHALLPQDFPVLK